MRPKSTQKHPRVAARITSVQASLDQLFPFHIVFDPELVILQTGRSLNQICPEALPGMKLDQVMKGAEGFDPTSLRPEHPVHLTLRIPRMKLVLRGAVVAAGDEGAFAFLASVWPSRSQEIDALPLDRTDFSPFDPTFEYVQELFARDALHGKRRSAEVLAEQRVELRRANRRLEALYAVSQVLDRATSLDGAIGPVLKALCDALRTRSVCFWLADSEGVERMATHDANSGDARGDAEPEPTLAEQTRSAGTRQERGSRVIYPVRGANEVLGLLDIEGASADEDGDLLAEEIARNLGLFIDKRRAAAEIMRARDDAQAATKLKSAFLANMSHEVRTPLNAIIGMMDLVLAGELGESEREYVQLSQSAGRDLLRIVNDILDFSKVEAGQLETESVDFDLSDLVQRLVLQQSPIAKEKRLKLLASYDPLAPRWFRGDPMRIGQVLGNLLGNAIKFTEAGEVSLRVRPTSHGNIHFEVSDTGSGITESARASIFQPFRQADSSTTRRYGGTGLGLAIARALCQKMGGQLEFTSTVGKGSRFWFELPLVATTAPAIPIIDPGAPLPRDRTPRRARRVVLVAEDNVVNQRLLRGFLEHIGYDAHIVESGEKVVDAARGARYAAILMDWQMPVMDGLEATRRIRMEEKNRRPVPIIALTAHALRGDRERCLAAGMNDYLTKPVRLEELRVSLERWAGPANKAISTAGSIPPIPLPPSQLSHRQVLDGNRVGGQQVSDAPVGRTSPSRSFTPSGGVRASVQPGTGASVRPSQSQGSHALVGTRPTPTHTSAPSAPNPSTRSMGVPPPSASRGGSKGTATSLGKAVSGTSGVDLVALRALGGSLQSEDDASLIAEVVGVYLEDAPLRIARLRLALAAGDRREAGRQAHTLKGASANVCAERLAKIAGRLEEACRTGTVEDARTLLAEAAAELDRTAPVLREAVRL